MSCHLYGVLIHMVLCCVLERLTVSYSRSGGPGGQHVNKGYHSLILNEK